MSLEWDRLSENWRKATLPDKSRYAATRIHGTHLWTVRFYDPACRASIIADGVATIEEAQAAVYAHYKKWRNRHDGRR